MHAMAPSAPEAPCPTQEPRTDAVLLDLRGLGSRHGDTLALLDRLLACSALYPEPRSRASAAPRPPR